MSFGLRVKKIRTNKGFSQYRLANACGITQAFMSEIERDRKAPSLETLRSISSVLEVTPNDLLGISSLGSPRDGPDFLERCLCAWKECGEAVLAMDPREIATGLSAEARERIRVEAAEAKRALDDLLEAI